MGELTRSILDVVFESANIPAAVQVLSWAGLNAVIVTASVVTLREYALWNIHYRLRGVGGLWRMRLTEEVNIILDDWLAWFTPVAAFGSIDTDNKYDRACAMTPASIWRTVIDAPARFFHLTPFKLLVILATLTQFVPTWPLVLYHRSLPYLLGIPSYVQGIDFFGSVNRFQAGAALLAAALCGGTFAVHRASRRRKAGKLESALEYSDRITDVLREVLRVARKNINTLNARINDLPSYFPPSESDTQQRWFHSMPFGRSDFSVHFDSFEEEAKKIADILKQIEEENLTGEYFEINRRVSSELLSLGLYSSDAAGRLTHTFLDPSYVKEICENWFSQLSWRPQAERDEEIKKWARGLLTEAIADEVRLSRLLWRTGRSGILRRILFGIGTFSD